MRYGANYNVCCNSYGDHKDNCVRICQKIKGIVEYEVFQCPLCGKKVGSMEVHSEDICIRYQNKETKVKEAFETVNERHAGAFKLLAGGDTKMNDEQLVAHVFKILNDNPELINLRETDVEELSLKEFKVLLKACKELLNFQDPTKPFMRGRISYDTSDLLNEIRRRSNISFGKGSMETYGYRRE
jgi:hypothetical protein